MKIWDANSGMLLNSITAHNGSILDMCLLNDGESIITSSADSSIKIWNYLTNVCKSCLVMEGHNPIFSVDYHKNKKMVLSASNRKLCLWDVTTSKKLNVLEGFKSKIKMIRLNPELPDLVLTACYDGSILLHDLRLPQKELIGGFVAHESLVESFKLKDNFLVTCSYDESVAFWDLRKILVHKDNLASIPENEFCMQRFNHVLKHGVLSADFDLEKLVCSGWHGNVVVIYPKSNQKFAIDNVHQDKQIFQIQLENSNNFSSSTIWTCSEDLSLKKMQFVPRRF